MEVETERGRKVVRIGGGGKRRKKKKERKKRNKKKKKKKKKKTKKKVGSFFFWDKNDVGSANMRGTGTDRHRKRIRPHCLNLTLLSEYWLVYYRNVFFGLSIHTPKSSPGQLQCCSQLDSRREMGPPEVAVKPDPMWIPRLGGVGACFDGRAIQSHYTCLNREVSPIHDQSASLLHPFSSFEMSATKR